MREMRIFVGEKDSAMRYFLELRYLGAAYCGWQRQPDQPSVQQTLERALTTLLREPIETTGAGRTDTGVNASYYVAHLTWQYYVPLDVARMNRAAAFLLEYEDFTSFAKLNSNNRTNICHVQRADWEELADGRLCFTIRADRFLRNMVRAIVGTLVDVGRGRYTPEDFRSIIESRDLSRSSAGAPAQGLFLSDVRYPAEIFPPPLRKGF